MRKTMNSKIAFVLSGFILLYVIAFFPGCLISSVTQTKTLNQGGTFTATLVVSEKNAESTTPHKGVLMVLAPNDWTFTSGTYTSSVGSGSMLLNTETTLVYGNIDTIIPAPTGMKWFNLISDAGYLHPANTIFETTVKFKAGTKTGVFKIGYAATKNTVDMLKSINPQDVDNDNAWTDTCMNNSVTVNPVGIEEKLINGKPNSFSLSANYPNPFNPSTRFSYSVPSACNVEIAVYNSQGKEVKTLVNGFKNAGTYELSFDASELTSGVYVYKMTAGSFTQANKMILMK